MEVMKMNSRMPETDGQLAADPLFDLFDGSALAAVRFRETRWQFLVPVMAGDENYKFELEIILTWLAAEVNLEHTKIQVKSSHYLLGPYPRSYLEPDRAMAVAPVLEADVDEKLLQRV